MISINRTIYHKTGTSVVEIVVAVSVIMVILVALISATTASLDSTQYSRNKVQATKYAQEAMEWLRSERDANWTAYYAHATAAGATYCISDSLSLGISWPAPGVCTDVIDDAYDIFSREATLKQDGSDGTTIDILVKWQQGNKAFSVPLTTKLTKWSL